MLSQKIIRKQCFHQWYAEGLIDIDMEAFSQVDGQYIATGCSEMGINMEKQFKISSKLQKARDMVDAPGIARHSLILRDIHLIPYMYLNI